MSCISDRSKIIFSRLAVNKEIKQWTRAEYPHPSPSSILTEWHQHFCRRNKKPAQASQFYFTNWSSRRRHLQEHRGCMRFPLLVLPERLLDAKFTLLLDQAANVVAEDFG